MTIAPELKQSVAKKPASRWRNRWFASHPVRFNNGTTQMPGTYSGYLVHPSKEVAEQRAVDWLDEHVRKYRCDGGCRHLGAYPDEGQST